LGSVLKFEICRFPAVNFHDYKALAPYKGIFKRILLYCFLTNIIFAKTADTDG
jgi:hypothetical protein